jgi:hypothetical protein
MAKATAKSSSKASVKVVINERRPIRRRKAVPRKVVELPPVRIYHEYFSQPTFAQLPKTTGVPIETQAPPVGLGVPRSTPSVGLGVREETPIVGYTPPPRTPPTLYTVAPSTLAEIKREVETIFSREPVPNVFPGSIEPRTLFADERLAQAFDAGHIVTRRGQ